jgi:hypothetical protein
VAIAGVAAAAALLTNAKDDVGVEAFTVAANTVAAAAEVVEVDVGC